MTTEIEKFINTDGKRSCAEWAALEKSGAVDSMSDELIEKQKKRFDDGLASLGYKKVGYYITPLDK